MKAKLLLTEDTVIIVFPIAENGAEVRYVLDLGTEIEKVVCNFNLPKDEARKVLKICHGFIETHIDSEAYIFHRLIDLYNETPGFPDGFYALQNYNPQTDLINRINLN